MRVKLLLTRIYTVEQLGVLLAAGAPPHRAWTVGEIVSATRLREEDAQLALHQLAKVPLFVSSGPEDAWELLPDPETRAVVAELVEHYRDNPVPVLRALSDNALERIRLAASRLLALRYGREAGGPPSMPPPGPPESMMGDAVVPAALEPVGAGSSVNGARNGPRRS